MCVVLRYRVQNIDTGYLNGPIWIFRLKLTAVRVLAVEVVILSSELIDFQGRPP